MCDRNIPTSMEGSVESTRKATGNLTACKEGQRFPTLAHVPGLPPVYWGRPTRPVASAVFTRAAEWQLVKQQAAINLGSPGSRPEAAPNPA